MRAKMSNRGKPTPASAIAARAYGAARALVQSYSTLQRDGAHLLAPILGAQQPRQWDHYPSEDAVSKDGRYQWFYHSHDPEDRSAEVEHGHFHLFARIEKIANSIDLESEKEFLRTFGAHEQTANTRHLLAIGMSPIGLPTSLFTVNRWVTGDLPLSGSVTVSLLSKLRLATGYPVIDTVLTSVVRLHAPEIRDLVAERDRALLDRAAHGPGGLDDESLEVLSVRALDVDRRLATARRQKSAPRRAADRKVGKAGS